MIDLASERLIAFTEVGDFLPTRRQGRKVHATTVHRWTTGGGKGIVLDSIMVGGSRYTSQQALQRFCDALTVRGRHGQPNAASHERSPDQRQQDTEVEEALTAKGF